MNDLIHNRSSLIKDLLIINSIMSSLTNFQKALQKLKKYFMFFSAIPSSLSTISIGQSRLIEGKTEFEGIRSCLIYV